MFRHMPGCFAPYRTFAPAISALLSSAAPLATADGCQAVRLRPSAGNPRPVGPTRIGNRPGDEESAARVP